MTARKGSSKTTIEKKLAGKTKPKLAFYWAASCGGCEITITELGMRLIDVGELNMMILPR